MKTLAIYFYLWRKHISTKRMIFWSFWAWWKARYNWASTAFKSVDEHRPSTCFNNAVWSCRHRLRNVQSGRCRPAKEVRIEYALRYSLLLAKGWHLMPTITEHIRCASGLAHSLFVTYILKQSIFALNVIKKPTVPPLIIYKWSLQSLFVS